MTRPDFTLARDTAECLVFLAVMVGGCLLIAIAVTEGVRYMGGLS